MVGVERDPHTRSAHLSGDRQPPAVVRQIGADLQLNLSEPLRNGLLAQTSEPLVAIPVPAGRGGVGGVPVSQQPLLSVETPALGPLEEVESLVPGEGVGKVPKVNKIDNLLATQVCEQFP